MPNKIQEKTFIRDLTVAYLTKFQNSLSSINWSHVLSSNDPIVSYDTFLLEYTRKYEDCFPLKPVQNSKLKIPISPWITKGILTSARKKNRLYKKFMKSHNPIHEAQYKTYKNKLNHIIRLAKYSYYDKKFLNAKNDLKETWKLIYEVINNRKRKPSSPSSFKSDSRVITDPLEIANSFCSYYTNIGPNLASKIPLTNLSFQ